MNCPTSDEYKFVCQLRRDFPALQIARKTHATPTSYTTKSGEKYRNNPFTNLTYARMERFISSLPNGEDYMREYTFLKENAPTEQQNNYTLVRRWFVAQFPEFRKDPLYYLYHTPEIVPGSAFAPQSAA
jgi:hypothetical protein